MEQPSPVQVLMGGSIAYTILFIVFYKFISPLGVTWDRLREKDKVEWNMRIIAVINNSIINIASVYCFVNRMSEEELKVLLPLAWLNMSYFIYDTANNLYHYKLLKKNFVLAHHLFVGSMGMSIICYGMSKVVWIGGLALGTDVFDHVMWFWRWMYDLPSKKDHWEGTTPAQLRRTSSAIRIMTHMTGSSLFWPVMYVANIGLFVFVRFIVIAIISYHFFVRDYAITMAHTPFLGQACAVLTLVLFFLMNTYLFMLKKKKLVEVVTSGEALSKRA
eukprot:TRINITY_DN3877_c0_g4_i1.p1 TRINITY_DN3877_c0_g4~~TRINITY_DN3877_c0_g4_i1.p1  ORF type:complete len:275 (-),score=92.32 TRINITY_DN3877_c0_g4_i1:21-845(-)